MKSECVLSCESRLEESSDALSFIIMLYDFAFLLFRFKERTRPTPINPPDTLLELFNVGGSTTTDGESRVGVFLRDRRNSEVNAENFRLGGGSTDLFILRTYLLYYSLLVLCNSEIVTVVFVVEKRHTTPARPLRESLCH